MNALFSSRRSRALVPLVSAALLVSLVLSVCLTAGTASAAPVLGVSKIGGKVLLGGQATIHVTVSNTGTDRGYNLSLADTFTSNPLRGDGKNKTVTFVSASSSDGGLTPTSVTTNPATNALTVQFDDIRDLVPTEAVGIDIVVSPSDPTWVVGNKIHDDVTAAVNTRADGGGSWITGNATGDTDVVPIKMIEKNANQSTGVEQATGCGETIGGRWPFSYTIQVQNNYTTTTNAVVVTDNVPDGLEYLGMLSGPAPAVSRDNTTGITTLTWNLGDMAPSATWTAQYGAGVRYDYFGTANGGTNRPYNDWPGSPGTPVGNKTSLQNTASLTGTFLGQPVTDSDTAAVTAAYATVSKSVSPGTAGNGTTVHFTITRTASEYYSADNISLVDTIPDGLTYVPGSSSVLPDSIDTPGPGQTRLTWNTLPTLAAGGQVSITFDATVDQTWSDPVGGWVVAGDWVVNGVTFNADWHDTVSSRSGTTSSAAAATVNIGPKPGVIKEAAPDVGGSHGTYSHAINATVGDTVWFRVRMNTADGASPVVNNVRFGNVDIVDWIPQGTQYVPGSATMAYSAAGDFNYDPPAVKFSSRYGDQPQNISSGSLQGYAWSLGNVEAGGWWEVQFKVVVQDNTAVASGATVYDYGKLSAQTSNHGTVTATQYSGRDIASLAYTEPALTAGKMRTSTPSPLGADSDIGYKITLANTGTGAARNVLVTDTLPAGMRAYDPTSGTVTVKRGSTTLAAGTDYTLSYTAGTGAFLIDFDNGTTINTEIPAPPSADSVVTIEYNSRVDHGTGAGAVLTDHVAATWSAQKSGTSPNRNYGPVNASDTLTLPSATIGKAIVSGGTVPIGNGSGSETVYDLTVTVPARNIANTANSVRDVLSQDGIEYKAGSTTLSRVSGTPAPPTFSDSSTTRNPDINWTSPNPGCTLSWPMQDNLDNRGNDTDFVFKVEFTTVATGLITPVSQGGSATNPSNWRFWTNTGGNPKADNTVGDTANFLWNDSLSAHTSNNATGTTHVWQPYIELAKSNDHPTAKAGDSVTYTLTASNTGRTTSYDNTVVDTLPAGMWTATPTIVSVKYDTTVLTEPNDFSHTYNNSNGQLTFNFNGSVTHTDIAAGHLVEIKYTAQVDGDVGSGATLVNHAYAEYYSENGASGRHVQSGSDSANKNKASSTVQTPLAAIGKAIVSGSPVIIANNAGNQVVYQLSVTVPEGTDLYNSPTMVDVINKDGIEYVAGSSSIIQGTGSPTQPASFSGSSDPGINWTTPNPGCTMTWTLNNVLNPSGGGDYHFKLQFSCRATGLITPVSQGGSATDQNNWTWWWTHSGNPTGSNTAGDEGTLNWYDGAANRSANNGSFLNTTVQQPNLELDKVNNGGAGVKGGDIVQFTSTAINNATSTSYKNVYEDTLPVGMRNATPTVTLVTLAGVTLTENTNYWVSWDGSKLTVDLDHGGSVTNINTGAPNALVIHYTATVDDNIGAGASLRNIASIAFSSQADGTGRNVPTNLDVAQHNTDDSTVTVPSTDIAKSQNAAGNADNIGQPYTYTVNVTVPAHSTSYNTLVTDMIPDGLAVDANSTYLDGSPQAIGTVTVTPQGDGTTSVSWDIGDWPNGTLATQTLGLHLDVHVKDKFHDNTPVRGLPTQSTFGNRANLAWDDANSGGTHHTDFADAATVTATEPHLMMTHSNDAGGPVVGNQPVHYTVNVTNSGTGTSFKNDMVVTLPPEMKANTPTVTSVTLAGVTLAENTDYWVSYDPGTGALRIDLDHGSSKTNILTGAGNKLVVSYTASATQQAGAGRLVTDIASIAYNSWSGSNGRQTDRTDTDADNTKTSSITMQSAVMDKTSNAAGNITTIGSTYDYELEVTVPARTTIYNSQVTDTIHDGLTVTGTTTTLGTAGAVENPSTGEWLVTWNIGDYTNSSDLPSEIGLEIHVRVDAAYHDSTQVKAGDQFANSATLAWDDAETSGGHHTAGAAAGLVTVMEPDLAVTKTVNNPTPAAGDVLTYIIAVKNNGGWAADGFTLNDALDSHLTYIPPSITGPGADDSGAPALTWNIQGAHGPIAAGETVTLSYQARVNGGVTSGLIINNTAAGSGYNGGQGPTFGRDYNPVSGSRSVTTRAPILGLAKDVTANPNPDWGQTVTYRVTVTNNGDATASAVAVTDTIPSPHFSYVPGTSSATWPGGSSTADPTGTSPNFSWALGASLNAGQQLVLTFNMTVDQWAAWGTATNTAHAAGTDAAGTALPTATGSADINVKEHANMSVVKTLNDPDHYVPVGENFSYTITVTNTGNTNLPQVPLTDSFNDAFLQFESASQTPTTGPGSLAWSNIATAPLAPQASAQVTVTFKALRAGVTANTDDTATSSTTDDRGNAVSGTDTNTLLIITNPGLAVTKTLDHPDGFVPVGASFSYTIHVTNTGDTDIVQPVRLTDTYDAAYLTFVGATPPQSIATAGTVTWNDITGGAGLGSGNSVDVTVSFRALKAGKTPQTDDKADALATDVHGVPVAGGNTNTALTITNPRLVVYKALSPQQPPTIKVGENCTFRIKVANEGTTKIEAPVALGDSFDRTYLSYVGSSTQPTAFGPGTVRWSDVSGGAGLNPGQYKVIDVTYKALKQGGPPETTDTASAPATVDEHGDPVAAASASAYVNVGSSSKVLGATRWFLAEGSTGGGFDTWILLENPGKQVANANVTFTTASGPRAPFKVVLNPQSRSTIRIQDYVPNDFHISTIVQSDVPIVAERSMYWNKNYWGMTTVPGNPQPYEMKAGHANLGEPMDSLARATSAVPATRFQRWFPEGSTAPGFDTWILICNPGSKNANVDVHLMTPRGEKDAGVVVVNAQSRQTVRLQDLMPNEPEISTELNSDVPIVAERSMYWDPNAANLQPYDMKGGTSSRGSAALARQWYMAEGSTAGGFETFILVQNPQTSATTVTATFLSDKGVAATKTINMKANSRATFKVDDFVAGNWHVATKITASQPVVAERSMYWDKRIASDVPHMLEGTSATGVLTTGSLWTVPEGSTGGGFDSWILISNPTDSNTTAQVTFMTASGPAKPFNVDVPANTRYTLRVSDYVPNDFHVSTLVSSPGQIVVERSMYWDKRVRPGIQPYEMMGGHSGVGVDP